MKKAIVKAPKVTLATSKEKTPAKVVKKSVPAPLKRAVVPVAKVPAAKKPAIKIASTVSKAQPTVITANVDIGFGNLLYIRGEGAGLSWDAGQPLECVAGDSWSIRLPGTTGAIIYKLLINDESWSTGEDFKVAAGEKVTVAPSF